MCLSHGLNLPGRVVAGLTSDIDRFLIDVHGLRLSFLRCDFVPADGGKIVLRSVNSVLPPVHLSPPCHILRVHSMMRPRCTIAAKCRP